MKRLARAIIVVSILASPYLTFVNYLEPNEVGLVWNRFTGEATLQKQAGFHLTAPWVQVARVDTRPIRVCITSAGRGVNCKLVQFNPKAFKQFLAVQGFHYYWWANRISFNWSYETYRGMRDLLRGYAYGIEKYEFITILQDSYSDSG